MNTRWMKALAFLAAAGATTAVVVKSRRDPSWLRMEPRVGTGEPTPEGVAPGADQPEPDVEVPAVTVSVEPDAAVAAASVPAEEPAPATPARGIAGARPAGAPAEPAAGKGIPEMRTTSAREAAILFAYDAASERSEPGERVVVLAIGDVHEREDETGTAWVVVPLEISHRGEGRVPRTRSDTLHVALEGEPGAFRVTNHFWE